MDNKPEKIRVCFLEEWAPIDNDKVKKGMYEVSNAGRIRNSKGQILTQHPINQGYPRALLISSLPNSKYTNQLTHRLVASAFVEKEDPSYNIVNHKDGDKTNDHYTNLEWTNHSMNMKHAINLGLIDTKHRQSLPRYSKDQARSVCEMLSSGKYDNAGDLLESIGMEDNERNRKFVSRIKRRQSFADISKDYEF